jgi:nicotinamide-nucleotide amidase
LHPRNLKQAERPRGTALLANRFGTAPGLLAQLGHSWIACFPGVPREFSGMLTDHLPQLLQLIGAPDQPPQHVTFKVFGIPEADLQGVLGQLPDYGAAEFRSLPSFPDIRIKFASKGDDAAFARLLSQIRAALGWRLYGEGDHDSLAAATLRSLQARNWTLAVAESCTGGLIGHLVTEVPGASATFLADVVTYANSAKTALANVPADVIATHGAVSEEVALAMARGARAVTGADVDVATTGIAGPAGGSEAKPVGTVCLAVVWPGGDYVVRRHFPGLDRGRWKRLIASTALAEVRRMVLPE